MLCVIQDQIEMFIYILFKFKEKILSTDMHKILRNIDAEGNSLLHLISLNRIYNNSINLAHVLINFSMADFKQMLRVQNNDGLTPLFLAIQCYSQEEIYSLKFQEAQRVNLRFADFLLTNFQELCCITLRNKNGETIREYIERNRMVDY